MEAVREIEQNPIQLSVMAQNVGEWGVRVFDDIVTILAAIAAHDNRWDS